MWGNWLLGSGALAVRFASQAILLQLAVQRNARNTECGADRAHVPTRATQRDQDALAFLRLEVAARFDLRRTAGRGVEGPALRVPAAENATLSFSFARSAPAVREDVLFVDVTLAGESVRYPFTLSSDAPLRG